MNWLKTLLSSWSENGIKFFYAFDGSTGQKSVTLFFAYITFWLAVFGSVVLYFNTELITATATSIIFWCIAVVFYRLKKLDSLKIDLDDKEIQLNGSDEDEKNTN